jgi:Glutamate-cysteine ligase family 2(GCS2)
MITVSSSPKRANSPFYDGRDTGYASYRSQLWMRWPSAGPTETFGTLTRTTNSSHAEPGLGKIDRCPISEGSTNAGCVSMPRDRRCSRTQNPLRAVAE